ncbi:hypothetical protein LX97_00074 [Nonlabens dokdonensis]|jgi:hypothetical protein|uniref:Transmembrane protein n=2 Tax=Nonlabens dokdonensis TaxID=328515 RepID=L7W946_NONDD|nr:hypothetical protein [Nonlabens dokdonensis]AGC75373.1 hypothetical protein DDD_0246 [Nonlabens dokdonensis DSW-6]PZX43075.1 hypothetical protein LX97_00074 [Nonlabens dokdonensis]
MKIEFENLQRNIKRKYSFKFRPEFSESFKTEIKDSEIIPLILEVFEQLEWPVVYRDDQSVEAKRKGDWNKLTEKITVTKNAFGKIEVYSKSIEGNFIDFGKNSKRTGLFIAVFKKLAIEYQSSGQLTELQTEFEKENNWDDYEIPLELPKPKATAPPNMTLISISAFVIAILFGVLMAYLTVQFTHVIIIYEVGAGIGMGYIFGQVLKKANCTDFEFIQKVIIGMVAVLFLTNQYIQFQLILADYNYLELDFLKFMKARWESGLTIENLETGWIGLVLSWAIQLFFIYHIAMFKISLLIAKYIIDKIPGQVIEYTMYLFEMEKSESEVRAALALKGWKKKTDQDDVFEALAEINGFHEMRRE